LNDDEVDTFRPEFKDYFRITGYGKFGESFFNMTALPNRNNGVNAPYAMAEFHRSHNGI